MTNSFGKTGGIQAEQRLHLPGTPDALPRLRDLVVCAAEHAHFDPEQVAQLEMAVGEACSNIIEHAYLVEPLKLEIEVVVLTYDDRLEITIYDFSSTNFPIDQMPGIRPDDYIEDQRRRGLGMYIIRNFVDQLEHRYVGGQGNELRLVKFRQ